MRRRILVTATSAVLLLVSLGAARAYADTVSQPGPVLEWDLNEGSGTTTADSSGHANTGTLTSSSMWTTATSHSGGTSASFVRNSSQAVQSAATAVDTTKSFTVAAWANLGSTAGTEGIVSQAGTVDSAFLLKYNSGSNVWSFLMTESDIAAPVQDEALGSTPTLGVWTHLVGVFNATAGQIRMYVNGTEISEAVHNVTWNATGKVSAGRLHWNNTDQNYLDGQVDDVQIWNRALSDSDVADLYNNSVTAGPALRWDLNAGSGTTAIDTSGSNNYGTLASGATWTATAHSGGQAVTFDGTSNAYIAARGSAIRTDQSFSASAWAYPTSTISTRGVVSQAGTVAGGSSGFFIKFDPNGGSPRWVFDMPEADTGAPVEDAIATAANSVAANTWYHLVGTYNGGTKQMAFYVNGTLIGTTTHNGTPWNSTGGTQVGRIRWNGAFADFFNGSIDDVRVYPRVLSATDASDLYYDVTPGLSASLSLTTLPFAFGARTMTGTNTTFTATPAAAWNVIDARGTGAAWSATISATALTSAAGTVETTPRTLAVGQMSMVNGAITAGTFADPTTNITSTAVTFSGSSQVFLSSSGSTRGTYSFTPTLTIAVPANAYRSNYSGAVGGSVQNPYTATITVTIS